MPYQSYREVSQLETNTQRQLLQSDDGSERIWAAWALGTQLGKQGTSTFIESLENSLEPGVRRQLLVILAGLGEQLILRVYAQDDSDPFVRATACQYLIQTSLITDITINQFLRDRLFQDHAPVVQQAILKSAQPESLKLPLATLLTLKSNSDGEIFQLATEHLLARASQSESFLSTLIEAIWQESDDGSRGHLLSECLKAGGGQRMIEMCGGRANNQVLEVLQLLIQNNFKFSFSELSPLISPNNPYINACLARLLNSSDVMQGWQWLVEVIAHAIASQKLSANLFEISLLWKEEHLLIDLAPQIREIKHVTIDREFIDIVIQYFSEQLQEVENYLNTYGADDPGHEYDLQSSIEEYRRVISALEDLPL
jgi:hypothetical protein